MTPAESGLMASLNPLAPAFVTLAMLVATADASADQTAVAPAPSDPPTVAEAEHAPWSYEVRADLFPVSYRWSHVDEPFYRADIAGKSLYFSTGLGFRAISSEGHGVLVDGQYRIDGDWDGLSQEDEYLIRFGVAHLGYAYRYVGHRSRHPRRAWAITPHAALSAGAASKFGYVRGRDDVIPDRSPVFGARVGVDFDLHIQRFFLGWGVSYEILHHTQGALTRSSFLAWNVIPILRIGVNFGKRVQR